jgi:hypothetical protein
MAMTILIEIYWDVQKNILLLCSNYLAKIDKTWILRRCLHDTTFELHSKITIFGRKTLQVFGTYITPLVPPITLLIDTPISFTVSAASWRG